MTLSDRIREARNGAKLTNAELARATGRSQGAVSQWLEGHVASLKADTATQIERATGYRASWIVTGKGPKLVSEPAEPEISVELVLQVLGQSIESVEDQNARNSASTMLAAFIADPSGNADMIPLIARRLRPDGSPERQRLIFKYPKQSTVAPFSPTKKAPPRDTEEGES